MPFYRSIARLSIELKCSLERDLPISRHWYTESNKMDVVENAVEKDGLSMKAWHYTVLALGPLCFSMICADIKLAKSLLGQING